MNRAAVSVTKCYTSIISFSRRKVENNYFHTLRTVSYTHLRDFSVLNTDYQ